MAEGALRFGRFRLDLVHRQLLLDERPQQLGDRTFRVLRVLAEAKGALVSKDELMARVWAGQVVEDNNLQVQISTLRKALDPDGTGESWIVTVPGRGYRLLGVGSGTPAEPAPADHNNHPRVGTEERPALSLPDKPSLVVLPFLNMSGDPEQEYFADGMVEEITTALSRIRSLFVIARSSAFTYKGRAVDVRQVGRELGVRYVLEGSVRKARSQVRIGGQLVEVATGAHLWADRFEGSLKDVFDLQDKITASVVAAIEPNIRAAEIQRAQRKPAENLQAYDLMLRALPPFYSRTQSGLAEATRLLRQALATDPSYALGFAYLALCHYTDMVQRGWMDRGYPMVAEMISLAQSALARDPNDPEVLHIAGLITATVGGDLSGGIALLDRSIELNPNNAYALATAAVLQTYSGDTAAAISLLDRSTRHNPSEWNYRLCIGYMIAYFAAGEYERAAEWSAKALRDNPHSSVALRYRAASLGQLGRLEEGRQVVQRLLAVVPNFTITRYRRHIESDNHNVYKKPGVADALYEGLRRCGVPE